MSYREKTHHWRSAFRQAGFNEIWIKELRKEALNFLPLKVIAKVPQPYFSAAVRAAYTAIGKSPEWNLTIDGDKGATGDYVFFFTATASNSVLTPSQKSAAALLYATLEALEERALSDRLTKNILDALGGLDSDTEENGKKFKRGRKSNTGSVIRKTIARLLKQDQTLKNPALWSAIANRPPKGWEAFDNHIGKYLEGARADQSMKYERFCNVCGEERKKLNK